MFTSLGNAVLQLNLSKRLENHPVVITLYLKSKW